MENTNTTATASRPRLKHIQSMEIESLLPKPTLDGIKRYWRRWRHQSLNRGAATGGKKMKVIRLGKRSHRHRYWRIRPSTRLRCVPLKMFRKLKNAYMNFMLRLAGNIGAMNTDQIFGGKRIPKARQVYKGYSIDEFEARLIYEFAKTLVASHELYPM